MRRIAVVLALATVSATLAAQGDLRAPATLPVLGTTQLARSLEAAARHASHVWRDTPPVNADGTVNGYVEIARGDRRKWEFDMAANRRAVDRTMPEDVGGYPVNYGFVPQTVSYDGDPFDVLVLGPPIEGGTVVRGVIVGVMRMEDEKGLDSKVVIARLGPDGRPLHALTARRAAADRRLLQALQAARDREVLEGARVGHGRRGPLLRRHHPRLFPEVPRPRDPQLHDSPAVARAV